jgi:hypothetical protein
MDSGGKEGISLRSGTLQLKPATHTHWQAAVYGLFVAVLASITVYCVQSSSEQVKRSIYLLLPVKLGGRRKVSTVAKAIASRRLGGGDMMH